MEHISYHVISEHKNQFFNEISDVKSTVDQWKLAGENHIKIFRITTEELDSDAINLEEEQLAEDDEILK